MEKVRVVRRIDVFRVLSLSLVSLFILQAGLWSSGLFSMDLLFWRFGSL